MIALVAGDVAVRRADHVVVETASGVGYRLAVSGETLRHVPAVGSQVSLHAHLIVRDDSLNLYGFATEEERDLFLLLIGVQGVGPKVALAIVSGSPAADLRRAIALEDTARFQAIPGIGKKTAERIVLELKEKLADSAPEPATAQRGAGPHVVARDALVELGWSVVEAEQALAGTDPDAAPEERVRQALKRAA